MIKILIINGPNLNFLGQRNKEIYGSMTLSEIEENIKNKYQDVCFLFYKNNSEGLILDRIYLLDYDALIINPGALTHTSICLRDCLESINKIKVEVHLSNYLKREDFRKIDYISDVVNKLFYGEGLFSYYKAVDYIINCENEKNI
jgi:3-dehydroquinate dehydratase-2